MKSIEVRNVNHALNEGLHYLHHCGVLEISRNGPVLVAPGPVCTTYRHPTERVLFSDLRNANPFFHLMESLWMLAGRNDVGFPSHFNQQFSAYSDDGVTAWGAYGWRWRGFFGYDQLATITAELTNNPESRRCVLAMWNADMMAEDSGSHPPVGLSQEDSDADIHIAMAGGKDVPCNTHAYFDRRGPGGALNMTVCCRSNDMIWGAYGANAVHMSILMEYLAAAIGCPVGVYRQISNNLHMYTELYPHIVTQETMLSLATDAELSDLYGQHVRPHPLVGTSIETWDDDLYTFMEAPGGDTLYHDPFFNHVAAPMYNSWTAWKRKDLQGAKCAADCIVAEDWKAACLAWLARKGEKSNG